MAKFKIGDRVKAVKECDGNENIVGKIGTVIASYGYGTDNIGVEFDDKIGFGLHNCGGKGKDGHCWWCPDRVLEPVRYNEKIVITTDGKTTTAKYYAGKFIIETATSKCSPDDKFDFETGAKIAFERLTGTPKVTEEKPLLNTKICIVDGDEAFKTGHIYDIINGKIKNSSGELLPYKNAFHSIAEVESYFSPTKERKYLNGAGWSINKIKFVEVVK